MTTQLYSVAWRININAASPEEAAREARERMRDPDDIATHFFLVMDSQGQTSQVDLAEENENS